MNAASAAAVLAALKIMQREPEGIERLWRNTHLMKEGLLGLRFDLARQPNPYPARLLLRR